MKKNILIVDDHADHRTLVRKALASKYVILEASNGAEGVKAIQDDHVDMIILDLNMPQQGGIDTLLEIKHTNPGMKIIVVSGDHKKIGKARLFKADNVFTKPLQLASLVQSVEELLG